MRCVCLVLFDLVTFIALTCLLTSYDLISNIYSPVCGGSNNEWCKQASIGKDAPPAVTRVTWSSEGNYMGTCISSFASFPKGAREISYCSSYCRSCLYEAFGPFVCLQWSKWYTPVQRGELGDFCLHVQWVKMVTISTGNGLSSFCVYRLKLILVKWMTWLLLIQTNICV